MEAKFVNDDNRDLNKHTADQSDVMKSGACNSQSFYGVTDEQYNRNAVNFLANIFGDLKPTSVRDKPQ